LSGRKVYTFSLHKEEDIDLIEFLEKNKITKNVKKALRLLIAKESKEKEIEGIDKNQLLKIITVLSQNQNTVIDRLIPKDSAVVIQEENEREEIDYETKKEFEKIIQGNNGMVGPINLNFIGE